MGGGAMRESAMSRMVSVLACGALCASAVGQVVSTVPDRVDRSRLAPPSLSADAGVVQASPASVPTVAIGMNFGGADIFDSGFIPPDTMGAIGPNHFVELINGRYAAFDRTNGLEVQGTSLEQFWVNAGANPNFAFDPRVLYDAPSGRWFACSGNDPGGATSSILVAVSNSSDPTLGWTGFNVDADTDNAQWADFPTMGIDADGLYISANMFPTGGGSFEINMFVFPKNDLIAGSIANMTKIEGLSFGSVGFALQPVVDLDGSGLPAPIIADLDTPSGVIVRSDVLGPVNAPSVVGGPLIGVAAFGDPPDADQPGPKQNINTGDTRFWGYAVLQGGSIWAVQTVNNGGNAAVRWLRINPVTNTVAESGVLSDPNIEFYYPSIAVNDDGDVVVGCSGSGAATFASAYAFAGHFDGVSTMFGGAMLLQAGTSDYLQLDGVGRNRWGDYSATTLDPTDPKRFWTIQEFVLSTDLWGTQITEIIFPPSGPCSPADVTTQGAGVGDPNYGVPDGQVTAADLNYFVNAWVAGNAAIADVTTQGAGIGDPNYGVPDGQVTAADLNYFVNIWVVGCP